MTENEWRESTDPLQMGREVEVHRSPRKSLLIVAGCLRRFWQPNPLDPPFATPEDVERLADGLPNAFDPIREMPGFGWATVGGEPGYVTVEVGLLLSRCPLIQVQCETADVAAVIRDVLGNPFRPTLNINPAWLTPTVLRLAQTIYDRRSFNHLPELTAALEEAGCDNEDVLAHCRSEGPHAKGCWVLDFVLGKT